MWLFNAVRFNSNGDAEYSNSWLAAERVGIVVYDRRPARGLCLGQSVCVCTVCCVWYAGGMYVGMLSCQSFASRYYVRYSVASLS